MKKWATSRRYRRCPCSTPLYPKVNAEEINPAWQVTTSEIDRNVHSTWLKREYCKPAKKSDSYTTREKGLL